MSVVMEAHALTAVALRASFATDADLVHLTDSATGRDEPTPAAEILKLFAVGFKEPATSPDVIGGWFWGGWMRGLR